MPIYEYQCAGCNHHFDVIQKINDELIKSCPQCTKDQVIRLVSAAGFQLKGSGWYATDFKTKPSTITPSPAEDSTTKKTESASELKKTGSDTE